MAKVKQKKKPAKMPKGPLLTDFEALLLEGLHDISGGLKELCLVLEDRLTIVETTPFDESISKVPATQIEAEADPALEHPGAAPAIIP